MLKKISCQIPLAGAVEYFALQSEPKKSHLKVWIMIIVESLGQGEQTGWNENRTGTVFHHMWSFAQDYHKQKNHDKSAAISFSLVRISEFFSVYDKVQGTLSMWFLIFE